MLHIIGLILKILGIILLVILGFLLFLILSLLFVPFGYKGNGEKSGDTISAKVAVYWLFHIIHVKVTYEGETPQTEIYLFGIPIMALKEKLKKFTEKKSKKKKPEDITEETEEVFPEEPEDEEIPEETEKTEETEKPEGTKEPEEPEKTKKAPEAGNVPINEKRPSVLSRIKEKWKHFKASIKNIRGNLERWKQLLGMEDTKKAYKELKLRGVKVLKHILPQKLKGKITYGFDDPSITGYTLAAAGMFYPVYCEKIQIIPVFDHKILEGEITFKGRIILAFLLWQAWKVFRNQEIRRTYDRFRHKEEA